MIRFSMLLINNNRSKAYLQNLIKSGFFPDEIIFLSDNCVELPEHTENDRIFFEDNSQKLLKESKELDISFDEKEHVLHTAKKNSISLIELSTIDINSEAVIGAVKKTQAPNVVYSGPGGTILKKEILSTNKNFIHVHPGLLPEFRGSTTIYYSMLARSEVGGSVIIMSEGIDEGDILYKESFQVSEKYVDFDREFDPLLRARVLVNFFKRDTLTACKQCNESMSETFYIIHPVLKHLAIIKHNDI